MPSQGVQGVTFQARSRFLGVRQDGPRPMWTFPLHLGLGSRGALAVVHQVLPLSVQTSGFSAGGQRQECGTLSEQHILTQKATVGRGLLGMCPSCL